MGTVAYGCGCWISTSMFDDASIMGVGVCFEHSLDYRVHETRKRLFSAAGQEFPLNFQDEAVQVVLVELAGLVRKIQEDSDV